MEPSRDDPGSSAALGAPDAARGLPQHPAEPYPFSAICGSPCLWLAPMVGQSEAAFRMLVRRYGVTLCTTPMIDPAGYARSEKYRSEFAFFAEDRPLVVQFGGSDAATLVAAAELAAPHCDAVELNCGCPQRCARQGGYGAFLMEQPELLESLVRILSVALRATSVRLGRRLGLFVKVRVFNDVAASVALAQRVEAAGADVLTVHGRTRQQGGGKHQGDAGANWATIAAVKAALAIPVVSNGNVRTIADVHRCLAVTRCDGVMSGCGLLADPTLFAPAASFAAAAAASPAVGGAAAAALAVSAAADSGGDHGGRGSGGSGHLAAAVTDGSDGSANKDSGNGAGGGPNLVPLPSVAVAREYLALAAQYPASHQQVSKHLVTYLGPLLKRCPAVRDAILALRMPTPGHAQTLAALAARLGEIDAEANTGATAKSNAEAPRDGVDCPALPLPPPPQQRPLPPSAEASPADLRESGLLPERQSTDADACANDGAVGPWKRQKQKGHVSACLEPRP